MDFSLLQEHTVRIYNLTDYEPKILRTRARQLLTPNRFDLFAKIFYICHREDNQDFAHKVYIDHIRAFNPDEKEPGRSDKRSVQDFLDVFENLISSFGTQDFDDSISLIPVDKNGTILDGAHRVAALAFYDKEVTIAQFNDVIAKTDFDYIYFKKRGLSWEICDIIALEMSRWCNNFFAACFWPRMGDRTDKQHALRMLSGTHQIAYLKETTVNLKSLLHFIKTIYSAQSWTNDYSAVKDKALRCYGKNKTIWFVFFVSSSPLSNIIENKEQIRLAFNRGKDSLHITDTAEETKQIAYLALSRKGNNEWLSVSQKVFIIEHLKEKWSYFKNISYINFKVKVFKLLKRL